MSVSELADTIIRYEDEDFESALRDSVSPSDSEAFGLVLNRYRSAQLLTWPMSLLESYLQDLENARSSGKSIMLERASFLFGRSFAPASRFMSPINSYEFCEMVDFIVKLSIIWEVKARELFPRLTSKIGPLISEEDIPCRPSYETRLRSELMTYSQRTIEEYRDFVAVCWTSGKSPNMTSYDNIATEMGFSGAYEANFKGVVL